MKLNCDDFNQVYVWVDENHELTELSPRFDYEEDAENWYRRMKQEICNEEDLLRKARA